MRKALIIWGGWDGHRPEDGAEMMAGWLRGAGFETELSDTLDVLLDREKLAELSLIIPHWTMGTISPEQSTNLRDAVQAGVGLAGIHGGMGDAFRSDTDYNFMVGGQFVAHPDNIKEYTVNITRPEDPIVAGIGDFTIRSEQYYMHVDPSTEVLATTTFHTESAPWVNGTVMPVVWKRRWGEGRVFYCSLGHAPEEFEAEAPRTIVQRGFLWAARGEGRSLDA
ncbi:MAG: ThuA domain-containing protein [Verrucomicrobia bacterium]|nr:MAG: ThuA domain-containing protein [Verrucomicrobiota bacterium]